MQYKVTLKSYEYGDEDFFAEDEDELRSLMSGLVDGIIEADDDISRTITIEPQGGYITLCKEEKGGTGHDFYSA